MTDIVLLDFGGTLDADGVPWSARFFSAYHDAGGSLPGDAFEATFRESDRSLEHLPGIRGLGFRAMVDAQAKILAGLLPGGTPDLRPVADRFYRESVSTVERNRRTLEGLRQNGYRLGVVANFTGNLLVCLDELKLSGYFDAVADSAVIGYSKPDRRIFEAALKDLGRENEPCWMVGDNPHADIRGAGTLGLSTVWLAPLTRRPPDGIQPTARIEAFSRLPEALRAHERSHPRSR